MRHAGRGGYPQEDDVSVPKRRVTMRAESRGGWGWCGVRYAPVGGTEVTGRVGGDDREGGTCVNVIGIGTSIGTT